MNNQQNVLVDINELSQEIRRVDGNHSLDAGALAEALAPFISQLPTRTHPAIREGVEAAFEQRAGWMEKIGAAVRHIEPIDEQGDDARRDRARQGA